LSAVINIELWPNGWSLHWTLPGCEERYLRDIAQWGPHLFLCFERERHTASLGFSDKDRSHVATTWKKPMRILVQTMNNGPNKFWAYSQENISMKVSVSTQTHSRTDRQNGYGIHSAPFPQYVYWYFTYR
jgi:hypothetical protein